MKKRKIAPEEIDAACRDYKTGKLRWTEITRKYGIGDGQFGSWLSTRRVKANRETTDIEAMIEKKKAELYMLEVVMRMLENGKSG